MKFKFKVLVLKLILVLPLASTVKLFAQESLVTKSYTNENRDENTKGVCAASGGGHDIDPK